MTRPVRTAVLLVALVALVVLVVPALTEVPQFGGSWHPLRDLAVQAAVAHRTANAVSSVNFDGRAFDTFGEELILLGSVVGAVALLRPAPDERERPAPRGGVVAEPVRLLVYVLAPLSLVLGLDVVLHGHLTPGGGFQGGVVLATGLHLLYVGGSLEALERLRPVEAFDLVQAAGEAAFVLIALFGLVVGGFFLANALPLGTFAQPLSAGTVPLLSVAVGVEVTAGVVVLLAGFLRQALSVHEAHDEPEGAE